MMDGKIAEYFLVQGDAAEVVRLVNAKMSQGWEPLGGVAVAANRPRIGHLDCTFIQAMVRHARTTPPPVPPPAPPSEPAAACPHCNATIPVNEIKTGTNACPKCKGEFTAE